MHNQSLKFDSIIIKPWLFQGLIFTIPGKIQRYALWVLRAEYVCMYKNSVQEPKFIVFINHLLCHGSHSGDLLLWVDVRRCATSVVR